MSLTLSLTITLAVLGLTGSLAAFGGETWRKENGPLLGRVTKRGWVALTCLLLAFAAGVVKEVRASRLANESHQKSVDQQAKLNMQLEQIQGLQTRLSESADAEKQMRRRFAELQLGGIVDETMLLASYTRHSNPNEWLGGQRGYVGSVQKSVERIEYAFENIQRSPALAGLLSKRFVDVVPWAIGGLKKHSVDPLGRRDRLNYYACGLLSATGGLLTSMDKPEILKTCEGENIRSTACRAELTSELAKHSMGAGRYSDVCPWADSNQAGAAAKADS